jgi:hypothetical protein
VNQLFRQQRKAMERLFAVGRKVRAAQPGHRGDLRPLLEERRALVADLTNLAVEILRDAGHIATQDARRRLATTLDTLTVSEDAQEASAGRLTADLEPLGFDGLAALMGGEQLAPAKVLQFRRVAEEKAREDHAAAARKRAAEAVRTAEKTLTAARREADRAQAAAAKAGDRAQTLADQKAALDARCAEAQQEARAAAREAEKAAEAVAAAERAVARARAALQ